MLTSGVLGDRYIGLEPGGAPDMLQDGDELFITQSALILEQAIGKYLFNTGRQGRMMKKHFDGIDDAVERQPGLAYATDASRPVSHYRKSDQPYS